MAIDPVAPLPPRFGPMEPEPFARASVGVGDAEWLMIVSGMALIGFVARRARIRPGAIA